MVQYLDNNNKSYTAYWSEYAEGIIRALELKKVSPKEYHGPCPCCGGKDRFWINEFHGEIRVNCRQCEDYAGISRVLRDQGLLPKFEPQRKEDFSKVPKFDDVHPYLSLKKIKQHGAKIDNGRLKIPVIDKNGDIKGYQYIDGQGQKKFNTGLQYKGCFHVVGGVIKDKAYIAEGFATAASIYEATSVPCVHALNANNVVSVVSELKSVKPETEFTIAGDNDEAGLKACNRAKEEHGVEFVVPKSEGLDWNDVWVARGKEFLIKALRPQSILDEVVFPDQAVAQTSLNYIVKGWLSENSMSIVYGASNVGKSFFCMDMAYHIAANQPWLGNKVRGGAVLYLQTEGGQAFNTRLIALRNKYSDFENVNLAVRAAPINLFNNEDDMAKVKSLIEVIGKKYEPVKVLIVDTISRATQGQLDENSNSDFAKFLTNLDILRAETGIHVMLVGHSGKDPSKGLRGSSAQKAGTDTEIEITNNEDMGMRTAVTTKQRDMEIGKTISFLLNREVLGQDEDGDDITTCTIREPTEDEVKEANRPKMGGKNQLLFKEVFYQLRGEGKGGKNPSGAGWPTGGTYWCIDNELVRDHFKGKLANHKNPQSAYNQTFDSMIENGHIAVNEGKIWFCDKEGRYTEPNNPF